MSASPQTRDRRVPSARRCAPCGDLLIPQSCAARSLHSSATSGRTALVFAHSESEQALDSGSAVAIDASPLFRVPTDAAGLGSRYSCQAEVQPHRRGAQRRARSTPAANVCPNVSAEEARVFHVDADGPTVRTGGDALGLIYHERAYDADWIAVPVTRLDPAFFDLRTGVAGELVQKFVNYGRRLAVVGDIGAYVEASGALRDFVGESNRGRHVWFVADVAELDTRLDSAAP
ncbi:MAG: hypothetical protein QOJ29_3499 [Thermoleophilaceae bacterium]|nr:hypothetical protein [Thermoleophilaceae bacterium]